MMCWFKANGYTTHNNNAFTNRVISLTFYFGCMSHIIVSNIKRNAMKAERKEREREGEGANERARI